MPLVVIVIELTKLVLIVCFAHVPELARQLGQQRAARARRGQLQAAHSLAHDELHVALVVADRRLGQLHTIDTIR